MGAGWRMVQNPFLDFFARDAEAELERNRLIKIHKTGFAREVRIATSKVDPNNHVWVD